MLAAVLFIKSLCYRQGLGMDSACDGGQRVSAYLSVVAAVIGLSTLGWQPRRWPMVVVLIVTDIWFLAGIWYYEANGLWLNWQAVRTVTELRGFESSILAYLSWRQAILPLTTLCGIAILYLLPSDKPSVRSWGIIGGIVLIFLGCAAISRRLSPLSEEEKQTSFVAEERFFVYTHSPLAQVGKIIVDACRESVFRWNASHPLSPREQTIMASIYGPQTPPNPPQGHLVYILVESLETWALEALTLAAEPVSPYLNEYIASHNVLYVREVETQQMYGRSGDGQLITQTGLLPLSAGVACRDYGTNTYPNLAHFYADGVVINPYRIPVWNQQTVTTSYGFKHLQSPHRLINYSDSTVFSNARKYLSEATVPTAVLALTIDTHTPFRSHKDSLPLADLYSPTEQDYLQSVHYTDRQIGHFLAWTDTATTMQNATIVITADHNHFPQENERGYCPFILLSPQVIRSVYYPQALQIDLFPTVLHAINQTSYAWQGFGIDLLRSDAEQRLSSRTVSNKEAYILSDKLIRSNYFGR